MTEKVYPERSKMLDVKSQECVCRDWRACIFFRWRCCVCSKRWCNGKRCVQEVFQNEEAALWTL